VTFPRQTLIGLAGGVFTGLFFGERASALAWVADGFVKLLQMMVLPFVTVSIIGSLGSLQAAELRTLGLRTAAVIGGLWLVAITFAFLIPLTFPAITSGSFFSSSLIEPPAAFNFVDLYVPANPFHALAHNVVPAVVLFSMALGIALVGIEQRGRLLDVLSVVRTAIARVTRFVTRLTPYGLFAIAANAAGTMDLQSLERLQIYLVAYVTVALLVGLWVLPALVAALTPIRARDILSESQDSLLTAAIAGDLFIVLPGLTQASRTLLDRLEPRGDAGQLTDVIVPVSFNFPHTGKLMSLSFILFAGWFADAMVPITAYPQLALAGLVTFFGSLTAAVPFLLDLVRVPADTFQLFLATSVINSRIGALVAAVHTLSVALLATAAITGHLRWQRRPLLRYAGVTAALVLLLIGGLRLLFTTVLSPRQSQGTVLASMELLNTPVAATLATTPSPAPPTSQPPLETIQARGLLRVGYLPDALPFTFVNTAGRLVGFDAELAHDLARELRVTLAFVPVDRATMAARLAEGYCDLVMSGIVVTTERAQELLLSDSYLDETFAFVVPDHQRGRFAEWSGLRAQARLTIAVPDVPYYSRRLRDLLPQATLVPGDVESWFSARVQADALALPAERGSAWTLKYPAYAVVAPQPALARVPLAYPIGRDDEPLRRFVNTWIALKRKDGSLDAIFRHWILGQGAAHRAPRWSIGRDVLHWME
jgi:Na+/H+-dicarboxylate symporter/ABC-type amino acid transport substrate-binding protein